MDFPFGHHNHHRRDDEEEENQYPPPSFQPQRHHQQPPQDEYPQPPPSSYSQQPPPYYRNDDVQHHHHPLQSHHHQRPNPSPYGIEEEDIYGRPPRTNPQSDYGYPQPTAGGDYYAPPPPSVQHVSHHQGYEPNPPSEFRQETQTLYTRPQHGGFDGGSGAEFPSNKPTVRVYSKAETNFSLTIRDGHVILAPSDENDVYQHWIKDERYSIRVKDEEGFPSFALVNKATGQAIKHSTGATHPVQLVPYNSEALDQSILWSESRDLGDSYRCIRMVNNIRLNMDAFNGDKNHGGVRDGTTIVLWEWKKGDNQRWKIAPYYERREKKPIVKLERYQLRGYLLAVFECVI